MLTTGQASSCIGGMVAMSMITLVLVAVVVGSRSE